MFQRHATLGHLAGGDHKRASRARGALCGPAQPGWWSRQGLLRSPTDRTRRSCSTTSSSATFGIGRIRSDWRRLRNLRNTFAALQRSGGVYFLLLLPTVGEKPLWNALG